MQFKLPFKKRIPLVLLQRNGMIYCQMQYEVLREDRRKPGYYVEMYELGQNKPAFEIGRFILNKNWVHSPRLAAQQALLI